MVPLNVFLGVFLVFLVGAVVVVTVVAAWTAPDAVEHLVELAKAIFSLPVFGGATLAWLGGTYREEIRTFLTRWTPGRAPGGAASTDALLMDWLGAHGAAGASHDAVLRWLQQRKSGTEVLAQLEQRQWVERSSSGGEWLLSAQGSQVLLEWLERTD